MDSCGKERCGEQRLDESHQPILSVSFVVQIRVCEQYYKKGNIPHGSIDGSQEGVHDSSEDKLRQLGRSARSRQMSGDTLQQHFSI